MSRRSLAFAHHSPACAGKPRTFCFSWFDIILLCFTWHHELQGREAHEKEFPTACNPAVITSQFRFKITCSRAAGLVFLVISLPSKKSHHYKNHPDPDSLTHTLILSPDSTPVVASTCLSLSLSRSVIHHDKDWCERIWSLSLPIWSPDPSSSGECSPTTTWDGWLCLSGGYYPRSNGWPHRPTIPHRQYW